MFLKTSKTYVSIFLKSFNQQCIKGLIDQESRFLAEKGKPYPENSENWWISSLKIKTILSLKF